MRKCIIGIGYALTEAKKFHNLLSARQRTSKVGGIIQSESENPRTRGADVTLG